MRALWRLRAEDLKLVDLNSQETVFTSVWYRNGRSILSPQKPHVAAMIAWEVNDEQEVGTFKSGTSDSTRRRGLHPGPRTPKCQCRVPQVSSPGGTIPRLR